VERHSCLRFGELFVKLAEHVVNATQIPIWNDNGLLFAENSFEVRPLPNTLPIDHFLADLASYLRASRILLDSLPKKLTALAISLLYHLAQISEINGS
jgi:hypothetical protein